MPAYPPEAYSPSGQLWWEHTTWPDKPNDKFGAEPRLAAWLAFNAQPGDILTLRDLREVLGEPESPNSKDRFSRRFRELRKYGWILPSGREDAALRPDEYRLDHIGSPIWLGKSRFRKQAVSAKVRREVFDRDGHRCVVCGIAAGECYPDEPAKRARLTLGHFVASRLQGSNDALNLRTECSRCNEPAKEEAPRSESAAELWPRIRALPRGDKTRLLLWINQDQRSRDSVDRLFDQFRCLPALQRNEIRTKLTQAVKGSVATPDS